MEGRSISISWQRLNRGHGYLGRRRWHEVTQRHVDDEGQAQGPWQLAAQDRERWASLEQGFVARMSRRTDAPPTHRGTLMLRPEQALRKPFVGTRTCLFVYRTGLSLHEAALHVFPIRYCTFGLSPAQHSGGKWTARCARGETSFPVDRFA